MKTKIKKRLICMSVVILVCCSLVVPAFASSYQLIDPLRTEPYLDPDGFMLSVDGASSYHYVLMPGRYHIECTPLPNDGYFDDQMFITARLDSVEGFGVPLSVSADGFDLSITSDMVFPDNMGDFSGGCGLIINAVGTPVNVFYVGPVYEYRNVAEEILSLWSVIMSWLVSAVFAAIPVFYVAGEGLTFIGFLAIAGMAVSVAFLFVMIIKRFLRFGG